MYLYGPNGQMLSSYTGDAVPVVHWFTYTDILLVLHTESAGIANGFTANYSIALCPNNCTGNGDCVLTGGGTAGGCVCAAGRKGPDCSVPAATPMWRSDLHPPPPRALIGARGVYDAVDDMVRAPVCAHPNPKQPLNTGS